ncbi:MAG TPA: helix-turn-helix transcriptional regulator [Candidatus Manganitrophaceae bacterium]|nr:helix-turn-helix transcriptional regulator [Candidatus Manganitrophaceae bacterium]
MEKLSREEVGERIKSIRGTRTQEEFAKALGVRKQNYISRYERNRIPSAQLLLKIARIGQVSIDWLLTGKQDAGRKSALPKNGRDAGKKSPAGRKRS